MIFAGYCVVGCLTSYATYKIVTKYMIKPFASTYRFLSNQSRDVKGVIASKYGSGLAVICGGTSGLSMTYSDYLAELGFETILLIQANSDKMLALKERLLKRHKKHDRQLFILTYEYDF